VDGIEQNEAGVWIAPSGTEVAWFKDPEGTRCPCPAAEPAVANVYVAQWPSIDVCTRLEGAASVPGRAVDAPSL
jgi:hypothetical protein